MEAGGGQHSGVDIAAPTDAYVRAAGPGTVVDVGEDRVYGRFILLEHGGGYRSRYAHASTTFVERGQRVRRNEIIALTGSTGRSTAPHLHFEILMNGDPVDPLTLVDQP
jgi:murein DD-endopeptidase MepM/ murein hydrolase activator NlpD